MTVERPVEIELKYAVADRAIGERLLNAETLAGFRATGAARPVQHEDRYVDSADGALARAGFAARLRTAHSGTVITVKSTGDASGSLHRREELEGPADRTSDPTGWPASGARSLILELVGDGPLVELVTIRQFRRRRDLELPSGEAAVELSLDEVDVVSRGRVIERFLELELELTRGSVGDLAPLQGLLDGHHGLSAAPESKLERALQATRRGAGRTPPSASRPVLIEARRLETTPIEPPATAPRAGEAAVDRADASTGEPAVAETPLTIEPPPAEPVGTAVDLGTLAPDEPGTSIDATAEPEDVAAPQDVDETPVEAAEALVEVAEAEALNALAVTEAASGADAPTEAASDVVADPPSAQADVIELGPTVGDPIPSPASPDGAPEPAAAEAVPIAPDVAPETLLERTPEDGAVEGAVIDLEAIDDAPELIDEAEAATPLVIGESIDAKVVGEIPVGKTPGVTADDLHAEAGRKVLRFHLARMIAREPGTREGKDPEELHAMRVSTRRMRAAWRVFGDGFRDERTARFRRRLRTVAARLGTVRDLDVLIEATETFAATLPSAERDGLEPLVHAWREQRAVGRRLLIQELDSGGYRRFVENYRDFVMTSGADVRPVDPTQPHRVRDTAGSAIWTAYEQVRAYESVLKWADVPTLHMLRIEAKRLRYTLEFVREALGPEAPALITRVVALQDHLGEMNDAEIGANMARAFLVEHAGELTDSQASAIGRYLVAREREVARFKRTVGVPWRGVAGMTFRRALGRTIAIL